MIEATLRFEDVAVTAPNYSTMVNRLAYVSYMCITVTVEEKWQHINSFQDRKENISYSESI